MRGSAGLTSLLLLVITALPACKAVLDADGYEADDEAFLACGEGVSWPIDFRIRACVNSVSCNPNPPPYTISECLTYDPMELFSGEATAYDDCDAYRELNAEAFIAPGKCSDLTLRCEDNIFYNCSKGTQIDCSKRGGTCHLWTESGSQSGGCAFPSLDASCTGTDPTERCSGNISFICSDGVAIGRDCTKEFATCDPADGVCYLDSGVKCDDDGYWCEGDTAFECSAGVLYERKCGDRGLTCDRRVGSVCIARGCSQQDFRACSEECVDTSSAVVCFGGVPRTIDCKAYGFTLCQETTHPDRGGLNLVRCAN